MPLAKAIVRFGLWGLIVLFACPATHALAADDVWALLRKPGHVVLLRHSNAPGSQTESNDMNFKDCSIQRNLDADGQGASGADRRRISQARHRQTAIDCQPILPGD